MPEVVYLVAEVAMRAGMATTTCHTLERRYSHAYISKAERATPVLGSDWELSLVVGIEGCCPLFLRRCNERVEPGQEDEPCDVSIFLGLGYCQLK